MHSHDWWFLLAMGTCFFVFAKPYGRALGYGLEGPRTREQRDRDARWHTLAARILGGALVGYSLWSLVIRVRRTWAANIDRDQGCCGGKSLLCCDILQQAGVAELADAQDLKSWVPQGACGFDSRPRHHQSQHVMMRSYFTNDVQFNNVANLCGSGGVVATTAMNRWPSAETVNPRGILCKFGILKSVRGTLHSNPTALV
jgi:hypothetical protein